MPCGVNSTRSRVLYVQKLLQCLLLLVSDAIGVISCATYWQDLFANCLQLCLQAAPHAIAATTHKTDKPVLSDHMPHALLHMPARHSTFEACHVPVQGSDSLDVD